MAHTLTEVQRRFLRELVKWGGVATPREIGPQTSQEQNSARQTCKRRQWVTFERGGYWRITEAGRNALARDGGTK
jgi:hypothetical protein